MEEKKNEELEVEETLDLPEIEEGQEDTTDWKAEAQKLREKAIAQRERTKTLKREKAEAEAKLVELAKGSKEPSNQPKTGELDETQLDYLDLKGITDEDQIDIIQKVMKNTGQTLRQVLKDDYVQSKLETIKKEKEVKNAVPSSTKRSGVGATDNIDILYEKFERTGELPTDFEARKAVIDRKASKNDTSIPPWKR